MHYLDCALGARVVKSFKAETRLSLAVSCSVYQLLIACPRLNSSLPELQLETFFLFLKFFNVIGLLAKDLSIDAALDLILLILLLKSVELGGHLGPNVSETFIEAGSFVFEIPLHRVVLFL